jgi:GWxTD domain-containing protein
MFDFWRKRDPNPNTLQNEYKIEYYKRLLEANMKFKHGFTDGYKTDRGRFYVVYGPPDEIERNDMMADIKGYEIWHYNNLEGGKIAVFAEQQYIGSGIYELVHSTIRNEYRDDDWLNKLKKR